MGTFDIPAGQPRIRCTACGSWLISDGTCPFWGCKRRAIEAALNTNQVVRRRYQQEHGVKRANARRRHGMRQDRSRRDRWRGYDDDK